MINIISLFLDFFLRKGAPKLHQLDLIEANGRSVRVISVVAGKWERIATRLYLETYDIERIERNCFYKTESSCRMVFMEWLDGRYREPVTWETLIKVLEEAKFSKVVRDLVFILSSSQYQSLNDRDN
ncbi:MAG: death domain-containing protein [Proteobacteria bacterium]|nr:death domain-containing protein [Pseudomonadota bacterium]